MQCRTPVLEKASKAVWDLILDSGGLGKEITETVEKVFFRLSGIDMMPPPPSARPFNEINRKGAEAAPNGCATDLHDESEDSDHKM